MVAYDPDIIRRFADDIYKQAAEMVRGATIAGFLLGGCAGGMAGALIGPVNEVRIIDSNVPSEIGRVVSRGSISGVGAFAGLAVFGTVCALIGRSMAQARASALRLQAQTALCQVAIEENTRNG